MGLNLTQFTIINFVAKIAMGNHPIEIYFGAKNLEPYLRFWPYLLFRISKNKYNQQQFSVLAVAEMDMKSSGSGYKQPWSIFTS